MKISTEKLIAMFSATPATSAVIGKVMGMNHGPDAITRLRNRKDVRVLIEGEVRTGTRPAKLYRVVRATDPDVPDCCGYCRLVRLEKERQ